MNNLNEFINDVIALRQAQRDYMADRGNDELGRKVAAAADKVDESLQWVNWHRVDAFDAVSSERVYQDVMTASAERPDMVDDLRMGDYLTAIDVNLQRAKDSWYSSYEPFPITMEFVRKIGALAVKAGEQFAMPFRETGK